MSSDFLPASNGAEFDGRLDVLIFRRLYHGSEKSFRVLRKAPEYARGDEALVRHAIENEPFLRTVAISEAVGRFGFHWRNIPKYARYVNRRYGFAPSEEELAARMRHDDLWSPFWERPIASPEADTRTITATSSFTGRRRTREEQLRSLTSHAAALDRVRTELAERWPQLACKVEQLARVAPQESGLWWSWSYNVLRYPTYAALVSYLNGGPWQGESVEATLGKMRLLLVADRIAEAARHLTGWPTRAGQPEYLWAKSRVYNLVPYMLAATWSREHITDTIECIISDPEHHYGDARYILEDLPRDKFEFLRDGITKHGWRAEAFGFAVRMADDASSFAAHDESRYDIVKFIVRHQHLSSFVSLWARTSGSDEERLTKSMDEARTDALWSFCACIDDRALMHELCDATVLPRLLADRDSWEWSDWYRRIVRAVVKPDVVRSFLHSHIGTSRGSRAYAGLCRLLGEGVGVHVFPIQTRRPGVASRNSVFLLEILLPDSYQLRWILKVYPDAAAARMERRNIKAFREAARVPRIVTTVHFKDIPDVHSVGVLEQVEGEPLHAFARAAAPRDAERAIVRCAETLAAVHYHTGVGPYRKRFQRASFVASFIAAGARVGARYSMPVLPAIVERCLEDLDWSLLCYYKDAQPWNWIVTTTSASAIDFEADFAAPPYFDLANLIAYSTTDVRVRELALKAYIRRFRRLDEFKEVVLRDDERLRSNYHRAVVLRAMIYLDRLAEGSTDAKCWAENLRISIQALGL